MKKTKRLFLIDGMAIIYRAYFAMIKNPLITKDGQHTSAIYGFINSILKIINDESPDYLVVVLDSKEKTFRHDLFTEYKANRQKMPEELAEQLSPLYDIIGKMNIPLVSLPGYEADDLIGTIAKKAELKSFNTYIVTSDKDMMQLVSDSTFVYSPGNRFKPTTTYTIDKVKDRWGIFPSEFIDYLSMVGDSSDNIPGVDGIGAKSAVKLLEQYGKLEKILENGDQINNKRIREGISKGKDLAYLSKKLVTIDCNAPCNFHLENFIIKSGDNKALVDIFHKLELNTLINKIENLKSVDIEDTYDEIDKKYNIVSSSSDMDSMIKSLDLSSIIAFDIISAGGDYKSKKIEGISFSVSENIGWYVPIYKNKKNDFSNQGIINSIKNIFENDKYNFCSQNIKNHSVLLSHYNIILNISSYDIILGEHLLYPEKNSYQLDFMSIDYCKYVMKFSNDFLKLNKDISLISDMNIDQQVFYSCERSDVILQIYQLQKNKLISEKLYNYYNEIEKPLLNVLSSIEQEGVYLDSKILTELSNTFGNQIAEIMKNIFSISGYEFNINSPKQLAVLMFDDLKLKEIKKRSTAVEVLKVLKNHHPIADFMLEYRHLVKLKNTYIDAFPKYIDSDSNRIHTSLNQMATITGRLSSSRPNFQNIPIRTDSGKEIRKAFCTDTDKKIISADYSQIELRIMAEFSQEKNLIDAFNNDIDIHTRTAALINNTDESFVTSEQRRTAKVVNFGIMYGAGPFRMSQELGISIRDAKDLIEIYFSTYPNIKKYMEDTIRFAKQHGYVKTLLGRRKKINLSNQTSVQMQKAEERALINMPIQGTAAELIKLAMINIFHKFKINNLNTKMILQIHDELLFESSIDELKIAEKIIIDEMEGAMLLSVPLKVTCNSGDNWYEAH